MDALKTMTSDGAMLADPASLINESMFEPKFWADRGELSAVSGGRGATWFLESGPRRWVLRHYLRGGFAARLCKDRYLWAGEERVRSFAEYRLLADLAERGLPVPRPLAARYQRHGLSYRCDLIMERIADSEPLSAMLGAAPVSDASWRAIGAAIARLHGGGVDHADLNAHNILLDSRGFVSVIDFDRGRVRKRGAWMAHNLQRLHRSLAKISRQLPPDRFSGESWKCLLAGYGPTGR